MKWQKDLLKDIRTHSIKDDICDPIGFGSPFEEKLKRPTTTEFNECNHAGLQTAIDACSPKAKYFLEIGVCRNEGTSSTYTIIKNVPEDGYFFAVDLEDKTFLNNKNVKAIKEDSNNVDTIISWINSFGVEYLDFIHIDAKHSINQVLNDWEYTRLLTTGGVVAFHDTTAHPGPNSLIHALDTNKWEVYPNVCPDDYGFGYCILK
jgi:predicted O-methyltransferase YrrM